MKKIILSIAALVIALPSFAQWIPSGNNTYFNTGNVGIGTINPTSPFHIVGSNNGTFPGSTASFSSNNGNNGYVGNQINITNATYWGLLLGFDGPGVSTGSYHSPNAAYIINVINGPLNLGTNNLVNMTIAGNGNVGIGITNPSQLFQVNGNISAAVAAGSTNSYFTFQRPSDNYTGAQIGNAYEFSGYKGSLVFETNNGNSATSLSEAMRINSAGNLLIGKIAQTNTSYKLDINGSARANSIIVNSTGADFVFDRQYILPNLNKVESYINENHHLPEIPSAEEMKRNGMDIGELNTRLLQKVEELTLYMIELQKQNKATQEQNADLKKEIIKIKKRTHIK